MKGRRLSDRPRHGHLVAPVPKFGPPIRLRERCPECNRGSVMHLSDDPRAVRYECSRHCGWDA